eukprot:1137821-Pelagomonas_calceolata.AAC.7
MLYVCTQQDMEGAPDGHTQRCYMFVPTIVVVPTNAQNVHPLFVAFSSCTFSSGWESTVFCLPQATAATPRAQGVALREWVAWEVTAVTPRAQ